MRRDDTSAKDASLARLKRQKDLKNALEKRKCDLPLKTKTNWRHLLSQAGLHCPKSNLNLDPFWAARYQGIRRRGTFELRFEDSVRNSERYSESRGRLGYNLTTLCKAYA